MDGPEGSPYAVRPILSLSIPKPHFQVRPKLMPSAGRQIPTPPRPPHRLPLQAPQDQLQDADLAPERDLRRARQHVHRHPETRSLEAELQDLERVGCNAEPVS